MKKFAGFLCIFLAQFSFGQNYQNICSPGKTIFSDDATHYRAFRRDSVGYQSGDSIFYSYKAFRDTTVIPELPYCTDLRGDLVFSQKVVKQPDGTFLFFNKSNDTLKVKTTATLNQAWKICKLPGNAYLEAKVTAIDLEDFLSVSDSVKTITFQARDQANNPISHPMNGNTFKLSKHYGFIQLYDLYFFPATGNVIYLRGKTSPETGFQDADAAEIYNWPVGAKFHFTYDGGYHWKDDPIDPPHFYFHEYIIKEILDKSMNADSVTYTTQLCTFRTEGYTGYEDTIITNGIVTETHKFDSEGAILDKLPSEFNTSGHRLWTINNNINNGPGKVINNRYFTYTTVCWKHIQSPIGRSYTFAKNLGMVRMDTMFYDWTELEQLIYFTCDTMTWGAPLYSDCDVLTGIRNNKASKPAVTISPNPVTGSVRMEMSGFAPSSCEFSLYDITGKRVHTETPNQNPFIFERRNLLGGLYYYSLTEKDGKIIANGKIIFR